jgi:beta-galactosidase GanA
MVKLGLKLIRMGEFSWSHVEPSPGELRPEVLLKALDEAHLRQIQVIFCTPTATPPKWLCDRYPDILLVDRNGYQVPFGGRRHYDPWSTRYLQESRRICGLYGDLFGSHPAVIGWQIDNEFGHHTSSRSFSDGSLEAFGIWLKDRYGDDINQLNKDHFNAFWSMNYRDFSEIILPRTTLNPPNPHLELDFYRFMTFGYLQFQKAQIEVLRTKSPNRWMTHNYIPMFEDLCLWTMSRDLDIVGYDHYQTSDRPNPIGSACQFALMRSLKSNQKFMILEQQPLQVNWQSLNRRFAPDWLFLWGMQAAFSGASTQLYFSWQRFYGGSEQYHEGIRSHDIRVKTTPTEVMISAQHQFFTMVSTLLPGSEPCHFPVRVLVVYDFESIWAHSLLPQTHLWRFQKLLESWLQPLFSLGIGVMMVPHLEAAREFLRSQDPFGDSYATKVRSLFIPSYAFEWKEQDRAFIKEFVASGGKILTMPRTAMKTTNNGMSPLPHSPLGDADFCFIEHGPLAEDEHDEVLIHISKTRLTSRIWSEKISIENSSQWNCLAHFTSGIYEGSPAIIRYQTLRGPMPDRESHSGTFTHFCFVPEESPYSSQLLLSALGFTDALALLPSTSDLLQYHWQSSTGESFFGILNFGGTEERFEISERPLNVLDDAAPLKSATFQISGVLGSIDRQNHLQANVFTEKSREICSVVGDRLHWKIPGRSVIVWRYGSPPS